MYIVYKASIVLKHLIEQGMGSCICIYIYIYISKTILTISSEHTAANFYALDFATTISMPIPDV